MTQTEAGTTGTTIVTILQDDFSAQINKRPSGQFELQWTDYVTGEWAETFPALSVAFARLAVLVACAENAWTVGFAFGPDAFTDTARAFLRHECE